MGDIKSSIKRILEEKLMGEPITEPISENRFDHPRTDQVFGKFSTGLGTNQLQTRTEISTARTDRNRSICTDFHTKAQKNVPQGIEVFDGRFSPTRGAAWEQVADPAWRRWRLRELVRLMVGLEGEVGVCIPRALEVPLNLAVSAGDLDAGLAAATAIRDHLCAHEVRQ